MDALGEGAEIAHALKFVIGQLDMKVLLDAGEQVESLEAVDTERLEKVVVGAKLFQRHLEMSGREPQNFVRRFIERAHSFVSCHILRRGSAVRACGANGLRQIGQRIGALDKLAQASLDSGASEEVAKDFDFAAQLFVRNRLDEPLRGDGGLAVEFA